MKGNLGKAQGNTQGGRRTDEPQPRLGVLGCACTPLGRRGPLKVEQISGRGVGKRMGCGRGLWRGTEEARVQVG